MLRANSFFARSIANIESFDSDGDSPRFSVGGLKEGRIV